MKSAELFSAIKPNPDFKHCLKTNVNPPLDESKLGVVSLVGENRRALGNVLYGGDVTLAITYKQQPGSVLSLVEKANGDVWDIIHLQGTNKKQAFRVYMGLCVARKFGHVLKEYAYHPEAEVQSITLPSFHSILNIDGSRNLENAIGHYNLLARVLEMSFSEELNRYVVDVPKR